MYSKAKNFQKRDGCRVRAAYLAKVYITLYSIKPPLAVLIIIHLSLLTFVSTELHPVSEKNVRHKLECVP